MVITPQMENFFSQTSADVCEICRPLFQNTNISYFDYQHHYLDGNFLGVTTHPMYFKHYLQADLYPTLVEGLAQLKLSHGQCVFMSEVMALPSEASKKDPGI